MIVMVQFFSAAASAVTPPLGRPPPPQVSLSLARSLALSPLLIHPPPCASFQCTSRAKQDGLRGSQSR